KTSWSIGARSSPSSSGMALTRPLVVASPRAIAPAPTTTVVAMSPRAPTSQTPSVPRSSLTSLALSRVGVVWFLLASLNRRHPTLSFLGPGGSIARSAQGKGQNEMQLVERLQRRQAKVGVIGLGYVGLPLARAFAEAGFQVIGFDIDQRKIDALERGQSYIQAVPTPVLQQLREKGLFRATSDFDRLREVDTMSICVPTPLTEHKDPDTTYIEKTGDAIAPRLRAGQLVVLEST